MDAQHVDVIIVGAGLSGIGAAYRLQEQCPGKSYAILESRDAIGGTWDLFRYPGIRSDSDMFTLSYPFRPWTNPKSIADGADIRDVHPGGGRRVRHRRAHPVRPPGGVGVVVVAGRPMDRDVARSTARPSCRPRRCSTCAAATTATTPGFTPDFPGLDSFDGQVVHPAVLARGPRLRGQEGRRDRQRRHRRHADPVDGRRRRAHHDAAALADLHHDAAVQGRARPRACARCCPTASRTA